MRRAAGLLVFLTAGLHAQTYLPDLPAHHPAIGYFDGATDDPVARLQRRLDRGESALETAGDALGFLPCVLRLLDIHADSQALVFSKTSFQAPKISPHNPRAIYFNDEVAVGFLRGESLEVAALDPRKGMIFYTLAPANAGSPHFIRGETCLRCHQGPATLGVPGIFVGSVYAGPTGLPDRLGAIITDHRTSFADRWGGWYVNSKRGQQPDRSNSVAPDPAEPHTLVKLDPSFNSRGYLSPVSDIVALMTFEHQTRMTDLLTRLAWQLKLSETPEQIDAAMDSVVAYMLFAGEAPLREPIEGVSSFTKTFPRRGPHDRLGRSLRDFDLTTRLFKYPLSYMIYSPIFESLPDAIRLKIYAKIFAAALPQPVLEILCGTKKDLPPDRCPADV